MSTSLSLIQQLKLQTKLSPNQLQVVRLLELPTCELQARIDEELQENPALEEGEDPTEIGAENDYESTEESAIEDDTDYDKSDEYDYYDYQDDDNEVDYPNRPDPSVAASQDIPFSVGTSFQEYLKSQIYLTRMDKEQRHLAKFVVGNIDDDGYLRRKIEDMVDDICFRENITVSDAQMAEVVKTIQGFDPAGVAALDLRQCLLLQLERLPQNSSVQLATQIIDKYFTEFSRRNFSRIQQRMGLTDEQMKAAVNEVTRLNPRPGSAWTGTIMDRNQAVVIPDFIVEVQNGIPQVSLFNSELPELHISPQYREMLKRYSSEHKSGNKEALKFVKAKVDSANWFMEALKQRNLTLLTTMQAIVEAQSAFFVDGDKALLHPLVLREIAEKTGLDISTISRVCNSKYVQTDFGIFPLKYFFAEALQGKESKDGEEVSNREIKNILQEIIDNEDKHNPIADEDLVIRLKEHGYDVARRTIAKYRDKLHIPVARLRRKI